MTGGGGGSQDSTIFTNLIPTYIPGLQDWTASYLNESLALSLSNYAPYPDATYAPQDANEIDGIDALATRGAGSATEASAEVYLQKLYSGGYIGVNPYVDDAFQKKIDEIMQVMGESTLPAIQDAHAFAFGGSEHNAEEAKAAQRAMEAISAVSETIYYDDYRTERRIQDAGLSHAVPVGQRGFRDAELMRQAGLYAREYLQGSYTDNWKKWNENQIIPVRNLDIIGNAIRTILGTARSKSTTFYKPPAISEIAGLSLTGMAMYGMWKSTTMSVYSNPAGNKLPQARTAAIDMERPVMPQSQWTAPEPPAQIDNQPSISMTDETA